MSSRYYDEVDELDCIAEEDAAGGNECQSIAEILPGCIERLRVGQDRRRRWRIPSLSPCESPIEEIMLHQFLKMPGPHAEITNQFLVTTEIGNFRMDFVFFNTESGRKIAVECDGKSFHEAGRDSIRDAAIIKTGIVHAIYRFSGKDCYFSWVDCFRLLQNKEPWVMDKRFNTAYRSEYPLSQRRDKEVSEPFLGYREAVRHYFELVPEGDQSPCYCAGRCECEPELRPSRIKTPTTMRYMKGAE